MTTQAASTLPFGLDPLIAEAKRRMRHRRLLVVATALLIGGGAAVGGLVLRSRSPLRPLSFRSPTKVVLAKAPTGASVICRNARMTTAGRVPAPGQPLLVWVSNYSGYAPALSLARRSDGSLVVQCK
jgi:hypothetical protein